MESRVIEWKVVGRGFTWYDWRLGHCSEQRWYDEEQLWEVDKGGWQGRLIRKALNAGRGASTNTRVPTYGQAPIPMAVFTFPSLILADCHMSLQPLSQSISLVLRYYILVWSYSLRLICNLIFIQRNRSSVTGLYYSMASTFRRSTRSKTPHGSFNPVVDPLIQNFGYQSEALTAPLNKRPHRSSTPNDHWS